ncbi:MAG TPA: ABC transporter permease [Streptosporangiaceae bacterium]|jgi:ABC transporter DrrB family efflux protein|nr:ABC transporter permease [Streptosporangiaceae bacterium]
MTAISLSGADLAPEPIADKIWWAIKDTWVLARRSIARIIREPEQLSDVTIQPVIFVLLFTYVFGSAIVLPGGGSYHQYLISGMFGMTMAGSAPGTAVGLTSDMSTGLIDRFRSLPMSRSAVLAGRTLADLLTQVIGIVVLVATGLAVGWRIHNGLADAVLAAGLSLLFAFAMTWAGACAGMLLRSPEAAQALGFIVFLPLSFVSNAFVPTQGMPDWLRNFANWNPMSAVAASCRALFGGPNPASTVSAWPMQHPELAVVIWSIALIAVFAPTAVFLYRRKVLK